METIERNSQTATVRFSSSELRLLGAALAEVSSDNLISDREFATRLGRSVAEGRQLLAEVREAIEGTEARS